MSKPRSESLETAARILRDHAAFDMHTHLGLWEVRGLPPGDDPLTQYIGDDAVRTNIEQMIAAGCVAASVNLVSDVPILKFGAPGNKSRDFGPGEAWAEYQRLIGHMHEFLDIMPIALAETPADVDAIRTQGKLAVFLSIEGAHMIEENLGRLEILRRDGITKFQPIHYAHCTVGDAQTDPPVYGGLSDFGKEAVRQARALGMVLDCAHATFEATADMAEATGAPVVLSHALMQFGDETISNPRWITTDHARLIAETGGMIGTWCPHYPIGARSAEHFVAAVMAMIDVAGIDHVGWATDHIAAGMGPWFRDYRDFPTLIAMLLEAGLAEEDLKSFLIGNAQRVMSEATTAP